MRLLAAALALVLLTPATAAAEGRPLAWLGIGLAGAGVLLALDSTTSECATFSQPGGSTPAPLHDARFITPGPPVRVAENGWQCVLARPGSPVVGESGAYAYTRTRKGGSRKHLFGGLALIGAGAILTTIGLNVEVDRRSALVGKTISW